jgi:S-adenosylmethionine:tRNA ribosyltransferase-isomerase
MTDLGRTSAYDYDLPPELVARYPTERRDQSRLLVVPPGEAPFEHRHFPALGSYLRPGDLLVLNESRVLPVRLLGAKPTGAQGEVFLLTPLDGEARRWEALVRPGGKLRPGHRLIVDPEGELSVLIEDRLPDGGRIVRLETPLSTEEALERFGRIPLPPYLNREEEPLDRERYQTVYAEHPGSVAAPTAGLHFTPELLASLEAAGVELARVTLHVGPGTFRPVDGEVVAEHGMHGERWHVSAETSEAVARTRARGGRIWAVGTTVVRTLESAALAPEASPDNPVPPGSGETRLFIMPGFHFQVVEGLLTNFHLPRSTLLMLVSALAGHERIMAAYAEAVAERYRFYSYGDAMLIPPRTSPPAP